MGERLLPERALQIFHGQAVASGGGLMLIKLICSHFYHVTLWGPGQGSQRGQSDGKGQSGFLTRGTGCGMVTSLPREQDKIQSSVSIWNWDSISTSSSSKSCKVRTTFIYRSQLQLMQRWALHRDSAEQAQQGTTTGFAHGKGFQVFPQSSSSPWLSLFCVMLMPPLHLPACQLPRPSPGRELPKEVLQPWDLGSWRSHLWETWALL